MQGLIGKLFIEGEILLKTGLHIGGSTEGLDIGGVDVPILRDVNDVPFIPGTSLKGKMRSLLEWRDGKFTIALKLRDDKEKKSFDSIEEFWKVYMEDRDKVEKVEGKPCSCGECNICKLFGVPAQEKKPSPPRLIVRDAILDVEKFDKLFQNKELLERDYGEVKFENTIDRLTSSATPRQIERVPAGAVFNFGFIVNLYGEEDKEAVETLISGMKLLEDDYLGGSGTRGYGEIKFQNITIKLRKREYYEGKEGKEKVIEIGELKNINVEEILRDLPNDQGEGKK